MTKILITGAGGYIGSVAADLFLSKGFEVIALDKFLTGFKKPLEILSEKYGSSKIKIYDLDLTKDNLDEVFSAEKIDIVIHYAAFCSVDNSMKDPGSYFRNNVTGTINLLNSMNKTSIKKLIFSSTCAVYGQSKYLPIDENHPLNPVNPYGLSKKISEDIIRWYAELKEFKFVVLRYFNVCGASENGHFGDSKKPSPHLVQNTVRSALGIEKLSLSFAKVNTPDKSPIRDYIDVNDLNDAHLKAAQYLLDGGDSQVINLGTGKGYSVIEIINQVKEVTGKKVKYVEGKLRRGDPEKLIASISKAKKILGWHPKKTLSDSINSLIAWYSKHPDGWDY